MTPVTIGAMAPPTRPPAFCKPPTVATDSRGAAATASAQMDVPATLAKKIAAEIAATASPALGARLVRPVKAAPAARPATIGTLRLVIGLSPRAASRSQAQPPARQPKKPNR